MNNDDDVYDETMVKMRMLIPLLMLKVMKGMMI